LVADMANLTGVIRQQKPRIASEWQA